MIKDNPNMPNRQRGGFGTRQFPGPFNPRKAQISIEEIRAYIRNQQRCKGFQFSVPIGASQQENISLPGTAKIWMGFSLCVDSNVQAQTIDFDITINNEVVIENANACFFGPLFMDSEYYYLPRPLSGQDTITIQFNNTGAADVVNFVAWYV
ncbi:MAG: hypothetical protein JRI75_04895 [Deltaproteobacteria bacterium]|nr:hypothetical protein [Deltaproteobacteria bacterium]